MKNIALVIMLLFMATLYGFSEETPSEVTSTGGLKWDASVSLHNQHYWRGNKTGHGVSFQAGATMQLSEGFSAGIWNGSALNSSFKEIDFYFTYAKKGFSISVLDYYCPREAVFSSEFRDWNQPSTPHLIDIQLGYSLSNTPFSVMVSTMVWGSDLDDNNENYYSTYLQMGYNKDFNDMSTSFILGYSPWESMYGSEAGLVNIETSADCKVLEKENLSMSINTKFIYNPVISNIYFGAALFIKRN